MYKVWILSAMMGNGFGIMPLKDETTCRLLMSSLHSIASKPSCIQIEIFRKGSIYAPEMTPIPKEKPKGRITK